MGAGVLIWKARHIKTDVGTFYDFDDPKRENIDVVPFFSFTGFKFIEPEWMSPALFYAMNKNKEPSSWPTCWCRAKCKPEPLLKIAARNCFWNLGVTILRRVTLHEYKDLVHLRDQGLAAEFEGLIIKILNCTREKAADFIEMRALALETTATCEMTALCSEEAEAAMDKSDADAVSKFLAEQEGLQESLEPLEEKIRAMRSVKDGGQRGPVKTMPSGETMSEAMALSLLPPKGTITKDIFNGRWRCYYVGVANKSRSWGGLVMTGSASFCLAKWCWTAHTAATKQQCPWQGLVDA